MPGPDLRLRVVLCAALLLLMAAPAARADRVTSLRPWAADNTYLVRVNLDGRTSPRLEPRAVVDYLKAGRWVAIACQTTGETAYGSQIWDKVGAYYVPDHYIKTYTDGFIDGAPRCRSAPPPPPPRSTPTRKRYVAMGDSYQSGEGVGGYYPAVRGRPYRCHRSRNAYSQLLALRARGPIVHSTDRDFVACSGAVVQDVVNRQLSALGSDVGIVTIGVGGNDVHFTDILKGCIVNVRYSCQDFIDRLFDLHALKGRLSKLYKAIRRRARNAVVIAVGYPRLFTDRRSCPIGAFRAERVLLNQAADRLDALIASVARKRGLRFVDPRAAFASHGVCSRDRWIYPYAKEEDNWNASFHPNLAGQRALAFLIAARNRDLFR